MTYRLMTKTASAIVDQQDDPGFVWEIISQFWPEGLSQPSVGRHMNKTACIANFDDGASRYPIDTPENTLASSMYFLFRGIHHLEKDDAIKIAHDLSTFRDVHGVSMPRDFIDFCYHDLTSVDNDSTEEYFADENDNLPITTPEQTFNSVKFFEKNASAWDVSDRLEIAQNLREAADHHGINIPIEIADYRFVSPSAKNALLLREIEMEKIASSLEGDARDFVQTYTAGLRLMAEEIDKISQFDMHEPARLASELESLDKAFGMEDGWGAQYPDPIKSIYEGVTPFGIDKAASYSGIDFSPLQDMLDEHVVSSIQESPEIIIPTLPLPQKQIVEEFLRTNGQK